MTAAPFGRFFLPGPAEVHPDVLAAMQRPMITHRGAAMAEIMERMEEPLRHLFRTTRPVLIGTCSATGFMEAAVRCGVEHRMLAVVGGYFGERFAQVAAACGKEVVRAVVPAGRTLELEHLERFLDGPPVDAVSIVHSETATGALAPLEALARVVRSREDVMLLVDAVTSVGGQPVETDLWQLDFVFAGSQKSLGLPPGLALGAASKRLMERARRLSDRGWYLDLVKFEEAIRERRPTQTPALPLIYALDAQLSRITAEGGIEARWRRHAQMRDMVEAWCARHPGMPLLAGPGRRSATVSALRVPEGSTATEIVGRLAARGFTVATGLEPLTDAILRIGHMGDLQSVHLESLLAELSSIAGPAAAM